VKVYGDTCPFCCGDVQRGTGFPGDRSCLFCAVGIGGDEPSASPRLNFARPQIAPAPNLHIVTTELFSQEKARGEANAV
jgi:hypothetical protein